jgi:hypothetical protein
MSDFSLDRFTAAPDLRDAISGCYDVGLAGYRLPPTDQSDAVTLETLIRPACAEHVRARSLASLCHLRARMIQHPR